jgi:2-methylisocitrate lyase-like PEP mutase family enzyme
LADLAVLESLVAQSPLPISASTGPGRPSVAQLRAAGVRRVSVGPALTQAAYAVTRQLAAELLSTGQLTTEHPRLDYASLNSLFLTPDLQEE